MRASILMPFLVTNVFSAFARGFISWPCSLKLNQAPFMSLSVMYALTRVFYGHWMKDDKSLPSSTPENFDDDDDVFFVPFIDDQIKFGSDGSYGFCIQRAIAVAAAAAQRTRFVNWQLTLASVFCIRSATGPDRLFTMRGHKSTCILMVFACHLPMLRFGVQHLVLTAARKLVCAGSSLAFPLLLRCYANVCQWII